MDIRGKFATISKKCKCKCKQECIPGGCVPSATVAVCWQGGAWSGGVSALGMSLVPGSVCSRGVSTLRGCLVWSEGCLIPGGCIPACTEADPPLWTEWLPNRCKNITSATKLRTVIKTDRFRSDTYTHTHTPFEAAFSSQVRVAWDATLYLTDWFDYNAHVARSVGEKKASELKPWIPLYCRNKSYICTGEGEKAFLSSQKASWKLSVFSPKWNVNDGGIVLVSKREFAANLLLFSETEFNVILVLWPTWLVTGNKLVVCKAKDLHLPDKW